ncbi:UDP-N-acetylmuramoyl-tripeptide--D-alanyl-D-alanine ligase [Fluviicoccus keumensis]|uniref:UDP-N-acetylmuramoyl-tripeptide--D-alanyl-D-alanine ligase n=1 Tax=Fluviicoccus keumensis TaxID=1435465 RepID=A0A4Q7ZCR2_9GAMM|nr:UDP-N-acetylmuramoyl-tripeptide--D-alanyl-D-alanine ligase [Fluviicoccus keumensis]RZU47994.1 UDP-N-acetylmuramoyl-tripeptide--D-alanyl-D-alanine ligase [Fluviicoccus keumensis]
MNTTTPSLAALCGARLSRLDAVPVTGVSTDTRTLRPGELFLALHGDRHDGHDHLDAALAAGAAALLVDRDPPADCPVPVLRVNDSGEALQRLAAGWRQRHALPGIAVCGSNGKTTVKDMLAGILRAAFGDGLLSTPLNHNNAIGVAATLLGLETHHRAFVLELGTNHPEEIAGLAAMARPTVALITNAQREHQEFFRDTDTVAVENAGALAMLPPDGVAVFPAGSPYTPVWRAVADGRRCLTFGEGPEADIRLEAFTTGDTHNTLVLTGIPGLRDLHLRVPGRHNALNAAAAATAAHALGLDAGVIRAGLESYGGTPGRLVRLPQPGGRLLIDDTYNANPDSVRAAIDVLAACPGPRWLVLADMGECGERAPEFHTEVGRYARERGLDRLFTLGEASRHAAAAYGPDAVATSGLPELLAALGDPPPGGTVLVKGSRFMRMERVVAALRERLGGGEGASCGS